MAVGGPVVAVAHGTWNVPATLIGTFYVLAAFADDDRTNALRS